jgi:fucose permease
MWMVLRERDVTQTTLQGEGGTDQIPPGLLSFISLVMLAMFAVGVETSLGGWLTTYSHRANPEAAAAGALSVSCFWMGMLLSRLAASTRLLTRVGRSRLLSITLCGTAASVVFLVGSHHAAAIDAAAVIAGFSIGPIYPLLLSFLLEYAPKGWIFAVAGLGSALFPWMTGVLSQEHGSLRVGLLVPLATATAMIALRTMLPRLARQGEMQHPSEA